MEEIWAPLRIENVKPYYTISNFGRIFSSTTNQFLIPHDNHNGYLQVSLMTETGRIFRKVHRLVLLTFNYFPGCEELQVDHKDCNKHNNIITNLEWVTPKVNTNRAIVSGVRDFVGEGNGRATITKEQAIKISNLVIDGNGEKDIAAHIGCSTNVVNNIIYGKAWKHLFSEEIMQKMRNSRQGHYMPDSVKHAICLYFQNNKSKSIQVKTLCQDAIIAAGFPLNDKSLRISLRLYYRYQNQEITSQYNY